VAPAVRKSRYLVVPLGQTVNDQANVIAFVELFTQMYMAPRGLAGTPAAVAGAARAVDATTRALTPMAKRFWTSLRWCSAITTSSVEVGPSRAE
jgi:hypothetical protein